MSETGPNIILIDDNEIDIVVNTKLLKLANLTENVFSFHSCMEAMDYISANLDSLNQKPNVILLDIQMPGIDGFGCLDEIDKLPDAFNGNCKVFMLSSSIDRYDIQRAESNNKVLKVLEKPLDVYLLKRLMEES
jgi:CheY-like chemotaxis protein